ncbi:MAG: hypothetical protein QM760_05935 [Nibricoccus sp.]
METTLELSPCREKPRGVMYRRWVISSTGLRQLFRGKFFMILLIVAWTASLAMAALGFAFSQTVVSGGGLEQGATSLGVRAQAVAQAIGAMVLLYPDVCVNGLFTLMFWLHSFLGLGLCLIALTVLVPRLVARDRASNALIIYLSRPLTSVDYLLGKLGIIAGLLVLLWTGPLIFGWLLCMLFAPNSDFFVYSASPLGRALFFNLVSLVVLASVALGVSALNRSSRNTILLWIFLWVIVGALAKPPQSPEWLKRASFTYNLDETRKSVLRLDTAFADAASKLPLLDQSVVDKLKRGSREAAADSLPSTLKALGLFVVLSSVVFLRKLRPE